jgi:hypothetical protein
VTALSAQTFALQVTIGACSHDKLRYAQALLGHAVPSGEIAAVLERALDALIEQLEKHKFCATRRPRPNGRSSANPRHIPAGVKHAVWERDGGQCSFVSDSGQRCTAATRLETIWNDGLAVVTSCHLREERPTPVARSHPRSRVSASGARAAYERSPPWARRVSPS